MSDQDLTIEARLSKQEYFRPSPAFVGQANVSDPAVYDRFDDFPQGFEEYAELLDWEDHWDEVFDGSNPPFFEWFKGGTLNASYNCVDRHLEDRPNQAALIWEAEDGTRRNLTYQDLYREVNKMAASLRDVGVQEDDVVTLHLPMVPALPITMLACARIGAPHSVVFGGFSASALAQRADDADSNVIVTIDGYYRRGEFLHHKEKPTRPSRKPTPISILFSCGSVTRATFIPRPTLMRAATCSSPSSWRTTSGPASNRSRGTPRTRSS